jgi:Flp pilus assembly protein TadD
VVCKLGDILIQTGKTDEAIPGLEKAADLKPSLGCVHYELGRAWMRKGQFDKAAKSLELAAVLNPTYASAYTLLGQTYARLGEMAKSQAAFQKSRSLQENGIQDMHDKLGKELELSEQPSPQN